MKSNHDSQTGRPRMRREQRSPFVLQFISVAAILLYGSIAISRFAFNSNASRPSVTPNSILWPLGPTSGGCRHAAEIELRLASATLADLSVPAALSFPMVLEHYRKAIRYLQSSLRVCPIDVKAAAMLAAVGWESSVLGSSETNQKDWLALVSIASAVSPRDPEVLFKHGRLLLTMGRRETALGMLQTCVQLSSEYGSRAANVLLDAGEPAEAIAIAFPDNPESLVGLSQAMFERGLEAEFVRLTKHRMVRASPELLAAFGYACLRTNDASTLRETLERLGESQAPHTEAERLVQLARAELHIGSTRHGVELAERAALQMPNSIEYSQASGEIALAAGYPTNALSRFRRALGLAAVAGAPSGTFAALYRDIGLCARQLGLPDEAIDAERQAALAEQQARVPK